MKPRALVPHRPAQVIPGLARAKLSKVFRRPRHDVCKKLHLDASEWFAAERNVEEDDWVGHLLSVFSVFVLFFVVKKVQEVRFSRPGLFFRGGM